MACFDDSNHRMTRQWGADPRLRRPRPSRARVRGSLSTGWEGFALARVDTNMIRASSRSAVSHLHVVASQPATSPDDAPLIERAVELGVLAGAVRPAGRRRGRGRRARRARRPRQDGPARARGAVRRRQRLPRAPRRAGPARAPLPLRRRARAAGGAAARRVRRGARAAARRGRGGGGHAAARGRRPRRRLDHAARPQRAVAVRGASPSGDRWRSSSTTRSGPTARRWRCSPTSRGASTTCRC